MLSNHLGKNLNNGFENAREQRYEWMSVEYLLLTLLDNPTAVELLCSCGVDIELLRKDLNMFIADNMSVLDKAANCKTQPTPACGRVIQKATYQSLKSGLEVVIGAHVVMAIFSEEDSHAVRLLNKHGATRIGALEYFTFLSTPTDEEVRSRYVPAPAWKQFVHSMEMKLLIATGPLTAERMDIWEERKQKVRSVLVFRNPKVHA